MSTDQPELFPKRYLWLLATGAGAVIVVIVLGVVLSIMHQSWLWLTNQMWGGPAPRYTQTDWTLRPLGDVTVETPFEFGPGPDLMLQVPAETRQTLQSLESFRSQGTSDSFGALVSRGVYKTNTTPDLDGAVRGALQNVATAVDDKNPSFNLKSTTISGRQARTASYHRKPTDQADQETHVLAAFVADENRLWQLIVVYTDEASTVDAERILNSFKIR